MNRDEPDVIMTKIREEKNGRGGTKAAYAEISSPEAGWCGRHPLGERGGHPAGTG
jgi:hypothetical protein